MSTCRSCGAPVRFVRSGVNTNAWTILDADPTPDGNVWIESLVTGDVARVASKREPVPMSVTDRYVDHHATCPNVAQWRPKP